MSPNTKLERLAERYDNTDTASELAEATETTAEAPVAAERMTTFAVRLPVAVLDHVREIAAERNVTTSAVIRQWIEAGIATDSSDEDRVVPVQELLELIGRAPHERAAS
jgi:predicted transcriptional regulator